MLQFTTKLMNRFSYSITTHFIPGNKNYHSCCNPHSMYQTYPYTCGVTITEFKFEIQTLLTQFYMKTQYGVTNSPSDRPSKIAASGL